MKSINRKEPSIGLILGDHAGIGPEIIAKSLVEGPQNYTPVIIGNHEMAADTLNRYMPDVEIIPFPLSGETEPSIEGKRRVYIFDVPSGKDIQVGKVTTDSGKLIYDSLCAGVKLYKDGLVDGLVMAPITKQALHMAGLHYGSEFEVFAEQFQRTHVKSVVKAEQVFRSTVVGHCAFAEITKRLTTEGIIVTGTQLLEVMDNFGQKDKGIAVAALNPHAGEDGLFGDEEARVIKPAIDELQKTGVKVIGPCPADTVFLKAMKGEVGGVVFLYHDQGNIAMKSSFFGASVLIYTDLPCPIVSVGHGSALDIAGKGIADPDNITACICTLLEMLNSK